MDVHRKYLGLRTVAWIAIIIGWIVLVLGVGAALWWLLAGGNSWPGLLIGGRNWTGLLLLPLVLYWFFQLFVLGSLLSLMTDLEYNTRASTQAIEQLARLSLENSERLKTVQAPLPPSTSTLAVTEVKEAVH